ncbi:hypothetical protein ACQ5SA_07115 [Stenotrophomonas indicatrix]|jgi:hypothetical protein|uniref:hypothetical protein n=1 Tax=Stenotrophomonas lactitubi TaxID=2045214 RepID=UPI00333FB21A
MKKYKRCALLQAHGQYSSKGHFTTLQSLQVFQIQRHFPESGTWHWPGDPQRSDIKRSMDFAEKQIVSRRILFPQLERPGYGHPRIRMLIKHAAL